MARAIVAFAIIALAIFSAWATVKTSSSTQLKKAARNTLTGLAILSLALGTVLCIVYLF